MGYSIRTVLDWAYGGVDHSIPGNGGQECSDFIGGTQRIVETTFFMVLGSALLYFGYKSIARDPGLPSKYDRTDPTIKRVLLVMLCMTFGIETGFKFASGEVIYLLNPCHIVTMVQIYLLAAPPSQSSTVVFRLGMHWGHGPILALLFPVLNTRLLPFEPEVYYIQHVLIYFVVPPYLLWMRGAYTIESISDLRWSVISLGIQYTYHFGPLQLFAFLTQVNLNNMLCPAISDPFYGHYWRCWSLFHQPILTFCHNKIYTALVLAVLNLFRKPSKVNGDAGKLE
ncbi:TMEM164 [Branchiostoma lanceolatum]|uniref:TMEM164 protein n=1 Tax=Branchiostoma lanceolatum TaxID=7740 RepID=A0A8K0EDS5_BRALA|nr:TMEM164 [Branchiostoma lanceolatum]